MAEYAEMKRFALGLQREFPEMGEGGTAAPYAMMIGQNQIGGLFSDFERNPLDFADEEELGRIVKLGLSFYSEYAQDCEASMQNAERLAAVLHTDDESLEKFLTANKAAVWLSTVFIDDNAFDSLCTAVQGAAEQAKMRLAAHLRRELAQLVRFKTTINKLLEVCV
jgi:hypothetical protein